MGQVAQRWVKVAPGWLRWPQGWATPCQEGSTGPGDGPSGHEDGSSGHEDGSSGPRTPTLDLSHLDLDLLLHLFVLDGGVLLLQPVRDTGTGWDTGMGTRPPGPAPRGCWGEPHPRAGTRLPISPLHLLGVVLDLEGPEDELVGATVELVGDHLLEVLRVWKPAMKHGPKTQSVA